LPNSATVAKTGDCCRIRQQSPVLATVAELGDYSRQCGQAITLFLGFFKLIWLLCSFFVQLAVQQIEVMEFELIFEARMPKANDAW